MATATKKKTSIKFQPLGDRVVVEREESLDTTAGGILLPDSAQDKPARGVVISVGPGRIVDDGSRSTMQLKAGERVLDVACGTGLVTERAGAAVGSDGEVVGTDISEAMVAAVAVP